MLEAIAGVIAFLETYLVGGMFTLGVLFFVFGAVYTFLLEKALVGNPWLVASVVWFAAALITYGVLALVVTLATVFDEAVVSGNTEAGNAPLEVESERRVLPVPNVPR